jgi:hypothetical protein
MVRCGGDARSVAADSLATNNNASEARARQINIALPDIALRARLSFSAPA